MIHFQSPEWFFLIPLLALAGWKYRGLRLASPLRLALLACLVLALADPVDDGGRGGMDLWVLVDRSNSTDGIPAADAAEIQTILERHKRADDRIRMIDFAQSAVLQGRGDPVFAGSTSGTDMEGALSYALAQMDPRRANRILMLTDGQPTTLWDRVPGQLVRAGVPVDYRLTANRAQDDIRIEEFRLPERARPGEALIIEATLTGPSHLSTSIPWTITREGAPPLRGTATLSGGKAVVRLTDRLAAPGCTTYEMTIDPPNDPVAGNNRAAGLVEATGGNGVLLLSGYDDDPLLPFLQAQGFDVSRPTDTSGLTAGNLAGVGLVIIDNLAASALPQEFLHVLDYYVREQGGGLLMCGGRQSFGAGGYFSSPIDALLPVSMELRKDKMNLVTAMCVVLDRSGSMAMSAAGGMTKMDLANSGACQTLSLLSERDYLAVLAVDSAPHVVVGMSPVGPNKNVMLRSLSRIESMGGGIFIGEGLKGGWEELKKAPVGTRHLILFADADDSEEPGDYRKTLADMAREEVTVSVIALGNEGSSDAALLREIADLGRGRVYFCENPGDIPAIFAQETVSVARSLFLREPVSLHGTAGWLQIASRQPDWLPLVDGYNLSYLKDGATAACVTEDGSNAPLVAFWNRGAGRVAAVTFAMGGEYARSTQQLAGYGDFVQTLARWLCRRLPSQGYSLRAETVGERVVVRLFYHEQNAVEIARAMPEITVETAGKTERRTLRGVWERMQPGVFQCSFPLEAGNVVRGAVRVGGGILPFGPLSRRIDPEWDFSNRARQSFLDMAARTGGKERIDLASIFREPRAARQAPCRVYLLAAALVLLLLDALLAKLGVLPREARVRAAE